MGALVTFESKGLQLQPESRPREIHLGFNNAAPMQVVAIGPTGALVTLPLKQMAHWLFMNRYRWVPGSQAVWVRH